MNSLPTDPGLARAMRCTGLASICLVALAACSRDAPAPAAAPVEVSVVTLKASPITQTTELPGRTTAHLTSQVRARVDGIVLKRAFREGADVAQGQLLFVIDPAPYRAAVASAEAALLKARANLASTTAQQERYKILVEANAVSKQDFDNAVAAAGQAQADVASAQAALDVARINLGYTDVVAPIAGRIGTAQVTEGAYVQASAATLLATIQQIDPMYVDLNQSSADGLRLRREVASGKIQMVGPHQTHVRLTLEDDTSYAHDGTLQFTDITVDQGTGTMNVRALFSNPEHILLPGMYVRARIAEGVDQGALLVPQVAVTHDQHRQATSLVVDADGKVALRPVVTGASIGPDWVVSSGLKPGDRVIVEGLQKVQPGQTVKAVEASAPEGRSVSASIVTGPAAKAPAPGTAAPAASPAH
jgi:membrane fusion protein (multidrug efflux system)